MKKIYVLIFLVASVTAFSSCGNEDKTSLRLVVSESHGGSSSGATVKLFISEADSRYNDAAAIQTKTTNSAGVVLFEGLEPTTYYWIAENGCRNNRNGQISLGRPLENGIENSGSIIIRPTGTFRFVNTSGDFYKITINGRNEFQIRPDSTIYMRNYLTGYYAVKVKQDNANVTNPWERTFTDSVRCGETFDVIFP